MTTIWMRAETRANERRTGLLPAGAKALIDAGAKVVVEDSPTRVIPTQAYADAGCWIEPAGSWQDAPGDSIILGLKELPEDGTPLRHRHILFGHAYKGQPAGQGLLGRFKAGGGTLLDLEYLTDDTGRRVAAFGYWAGYAGAGVTLLAHAAQKAGGICGPVGTWETARDMAESVGKALGDLRPSALVVGALGRVGTGVRDLCKAVGVRTTDWDMAETAHGGPFPEIMAHDVFFNCILAQPGAPVFVPKDAGSMDRKLTSIGDIACDPDSDFNPVPVYDRVTSWDAPVIRVHDAPPLDVMAIDNLPSLLPLESSEDFAGQLFPHLLSLVQGGSAVWTRAEALFRAHLR